MVETDGRNLCKRSVWYPTTQIIPLGLKGSAYQPTRDFVVVVEDYSLLYLREGESASGGAAEGERDKRTPH